MLLLCARSALHACGVCVLTCSPDRFLLQHRAGCRGRRLLHRGVKHAHVFWLQYSDEREFQAVAAVGLSWHARHACADACIPKVQIQC